MTETKVLCPVCGGSDETGPFKIWRDPHGWVETSEYSCHACDTEWDESKRKPVNSERLRRLESAERTLLHKGYTYHGAQFWKPPIATNPPDFDLMDRNDYREEFMQIVREKVEEFGSANQLNQVKEELAELIVAISHLVRKRKDAELDVHTELADVEFMLEQLKYILQHEYGFKPSSFVVQKYFTAGMRISPSAFKPLDADEAVANDQA